MIAAAKAWTRRHWPRLSLRTYLFASFFLVAALPGFGAVFLRVYENALVRQTEAELAAQGAALGAAAAALWSDAPSTPAPAPDPTTDRYGPVADTEVDLNSTPILPERPQPLASVPPGPDAVAAAARLRPILAETRATTLASIILLDREGRIVSGARAAAMPGCRKSPPPCAVVRRRSCGGTAPIAPCTGSSGCPARRPRGCIMCARSG